MSYRVVIHIMAVRKVPIASDFRNICFTGLDDCWHTQIKMVHMPDKSLNTSSPQDPPVDKIKILQP